MSAGCYTCAGRCCHHMLVGVTPFDIARIAREERLPFSAFLEPCLDSDASLDSFRLDESEERYQFKLAQSRIDPAACAFLMFLGEGQGRCGIYEHRPLVCAAYPFALRGGSVDVRTDARCEPGDWNVSLLDFVGFRALVNRYAAERAGNTAVVSVWNAAIERERSEGAQHRDERRQAGFERYCDYADRTVERFLRSRDVISDRRFLERWEDSMLPPDVLRAQRAWLAELECVAREEVAR